MHNIGSVKKVWSDIYKTHYDFVLHDCDYYTQKNS